MTPTECREALEVESTARSLKKQLDTYVLLQPGGRKEEITVGPLGRDTTMGTPMPVVIPESARRLVFNLWRRETALKFNEKVRRLAQLGVTTDLQLMTFHPSTGEPA